MATPHVSAAAALIWSANPTWTNAQIRTALTSTAKDLGAAGRDNAYGYGLVQAKAALTSLQGQGGGGSGGALTVTVTTNKAIYATRESATSTASIKDSAGVAVSGATVNMVVTTPKGNVTGSATSSSTGVATFKLALKNYGIGNYTVTITASKTGSTSGSGSATFKVQ